MYGYIYLIVNNVNGKTYVGKKCLYKKAWDKDNYMGSGILLKPAQKKYGIENFEKFLITWTYSKKDAGEKEKFWIAHYKSLGKAEYNIAEGGEGGSTTKGRHLSKETRAKISESHKEKAYLYKTDEFREKMSEVTSGENNGMYGKHHTEAAKQKMGQAKAGKTHIGHKWDESQKKMLSESIKNSEKHKQVMASEEYRENMSNAIKGLKWYNNGVIDKRARECPPGFTPGRLHHK